MLMKFFALRLALHALRVQCEKNMETLLIFQNNAVTINQQKVLILQH